MWCYQKPGFEALLLSELQRQQQCSQFCDTLLKTDGVSVPAHSCVLSAISPHISSALSSSPPSPAGQSRLLEFRALGACTLLHVVRLLYCGEMAGEGEKEKQEAISAAAKLGIRGLVEVTKRDGGGRNEEGWRTEVGVQTEPLMPEENEGRPGRWGREVTDGSTFLWRETPSDDKKDTWTQTEQLQVHSGPPPHPAASFESIDMTALQGVGRTDAHLAPPRIPYIPISFVYPPDENQTHQPSSALAASMRGSTAAGYTFAPLPLLPFSSHVTTGPARDVTAVEEWGNEPLGRFRGNFPGYISYFLHPDKEEGFGRGRARRRLGAGVRGARRAGTGERRARRPRARTAGRGRGGLTQTVDVQEVGVRRLQKLFLQRWGPSRAGQGGGAVGRKLHLKTRALLKATKSSQRRRGRGKVWEFSQSGDALPYSEGGGGNTQQTNQNGLPAGRARRAKVKPTAPVSFPSPHIRFYNVQTSSALSPSLQPSPAASFVPPASPLLLSTSPPPPAPPPHEEQPEHFDRLLEEVMMGLGILPNNNNNNSAPHSQPPLPNGSASYASCGDTLVQNKHRDRTSGLLEASPAFHGSTHVVAKARADVSSHREPPALQQQGEGELNETLDHFLQSFEQHVDSCTAREEVETGGQSQPYSSLSKYRRIKTDRRSQITELQQRDEVEKPPCKTSARRAAPPKDTEEVPVKVKAPAKQRKRRRKNEYLFSLEKKRARKPVSSRDAKRDEQLQQRPVVELERSDQLHKHSCLEVKSPAKAKTSSSSSSSSSSSVKHPRDSLSTKKYPIRSRFTDAHIMDSLPFLEEPLRIKRRPAEGRPNCSRDEPNKKAQLLSLSIAESSTPPIQPQSVEPRGSDEQLEKNPERHEGEHTVEPQQEAEGATKRGAESEEVTSDKSTWIKRICYTPTSVRDCLKLEDRQKNTMWSELRQAEDSLTAEEMEITEVDGDPEGDRCQSSRAPILSHFVTSVSPSSHSAEEVRLRSTGSWEEDIDVIGGCSPAPEPVIISWTESSEGEEEDEDEDEDIDVVG